MLTEVKQPEPILPCPHCGAEAKIETENADNEYMRNVYRVVCKVCRASTGGFWEVERAVSSWNRRV